MKYKGFGEYFKIFILSVFIIAVYKTFDNFSFLLHTVGNFFKILYPVFWAFVIAFLLYPACLKVEELFLKLKSGFIYKRRRALSVVSVFLVVIVILSLVISFIVPALIKSGKELIVQLPVIFNRAVEYVSGLGIVDVNKIYDYITIEKILQQFDFSNANKIIEGFAGGASAFFTNFLMSVIISIYILIDRRQFKNGAKRVFKLFVKKDLREKVVPYLRLTYDVMYKYIGCVLLDALIVFIISFVILMCVRVKYAPLLALMIGVMNIIPYFGAIISVSLTILITFFTGTVGQTVVLAICLLVMQQIDGNIIQPHIVKDSLHITPFWVLVAILIGGELIGFWGIIISVPVMALLRTIFSDFLLWREEKLSIKEKN